MRINNLQQNISFQRSLTKRELVNYQDTLKKAKKITGQTGKTIFIMPSSNLPQSEQFNSGIGSISSDYAQDYLEYMKNYLDFNIVEDLPPGQIKNYGDFYCAYISSSFALGNQQINPELLLNNEFFNLLTNEDLNEIVSGNQGEYKNTLSNFKNVASNYGKQNEVLKKAYEKFLELDENNPLKKKFEQYCSKNAFWLDFKREEEGNPGFFKFKQFIADEHLKIGKEKLNKKGVKLCGDCPLRFSRDEIRAFPKAFSENYTMGLHNWGIPSLNFDEILNPNSDAYKLLKAKVQLFAQRYDMIRFDVGWQYVTPIMNRVNQDGSISTRKKELGSSLLEQIETWVKEIKGENFDLKNLIWEFEAGPEEFQAFRNGQLIDALRDRVKIYGSTYIHKTAYDKWGYNDAFLERGWDKENFVLGVGNHDPQPLAQIAKGIPDRRMGANGAAIEEAPYKKSSIEALSDILKIDKEALEAPRTFVDAKWAETMSSYNTEMFYMDVFGREERYDMQDFNLYEHPHKNYAYKVPSDYKTAFHASVENGLGFNPMRALELNFKAYGFDKKHPKIYKKIVKFAKILEEKETINKNALNKKAYFLTGGLLAFGAGMLGIIKILKSKNNKPQTPLQTTNQIATKTYSFDTFKKETKNSNLHV